MSEAIKRLRGLVNGPGGLGAIEIDEVRALLDIAEAAQDLIDGGAIADWETHASEVLRTALAKLEAPGHE